MANIAIALRLPMLGVPGVRRAWLTARRYPVFPVATLPLVVVRPALFSELIRPHYPLVGGMRDLSCPPLGVDGIRSVLQGMGSV